MRYEYLLTDMGREMQPLLIALSMFGNQHFADRGVTMRLTDKETGAAAQPVYIDSLTGKPIDAANFSLKSVHLA